MKGRLASFTPIRATYRPAVSPPLYQGGELCEFGLIDPDGRRTADRRLWRASLKEVIACSLAGLSEHWQDGPRRLFVTQRLLLVDEPHSGASSWFWPLVSIHPRAPSSGPIVST
jgi:maltooligosyltrehalose synthase